MYPSSLLSLEFFLQLIAALRAALDSCSLGRPIFFCLSSIRGCMTRNAVLLPLGGW